MVDATTSAALGFDVTLPGFVARFNLAGDAAPIAATAVVRGVSLVTGLGTLAITARWLGPDGRGVTAGATAWATLVAGLCHLSVAQVIVRDAAQRPGGNWLVEQFRNVLLIGGSGVLLAWLAISALYSVAPLRFFGQMPAAPLVVAMLMVPWMVLETYATTMLPGIGALRTLNIAQLASRAVGVVLLVVLIAAMNFGVLGALSATLAGLAVGGAVTVRRLWLAGGRASRISRASLSPLLRGGATLHLNAVGSILLSNIDVIVVQQTLPLAATGIYQLAVQAALLPMMLPQAATTVFYGRVASMGPDVAWRYSARAMIGVLTVVVLTCLLAALLAPRVVALLAGPRFLDAVPLFRVLLIGTVAQTFSTMMAPQWIGRGLFRTASGVTLTLGISTMIALRLVVPRFGPEGAVAVVVTAYLTTAVVNVVFARWVATRAADASRMRT